MDEEDYGKTFELKTFLKSRTKDCVRDAISDTLGISQYKCRILIQIREARTRIAMGKMISESKVSVEEIRDRIGQDVKIANIVELLDIEKGIISLDEMYEKGEQIEFIEGIDASIRSRVNPVKTVYSKTQKIDKLMAEMNRKINMVDVDGCLVRYFAERLDLK